MHLPRRVNIITGLLLGASVAMILGVIYFALSIKVITNWRLTLPQRDIHAGDMIVVSSTYTKLKQVTGTSTRTLECQVSQGIYLSVPLNKMPANRAPGKTGTGILVVIPTAIKGIASLPDQCHICVALSYPVLPLRAVDYFKCTSDFSLLPAPVSVSPATNQTNPSQVAVVNQVRVFSLVSPSSDNSSALAPAQSNTSQPSTPTGPQQTANPQSQPSIIQQVVNGVTGVVQTIGGFLGGLF